MGKEAGKVIMETKTISGSILKKNGYIEFNTKEPNERFFQKKIVDKDGKIYFIDCRYFLFNQISFWEFKMQIETLNGAVNIETVQWFNDDGIHSKNNIKDVEKYFKKMWDINKTM